MNRKLAQFCLLAAFSIFGGCIVFFATNAERDFGLVKLFEIRGKRVPPEAVVIIAMDEQSEASFSEDSSEINQEQLIHWRQFHAKLIQELQKQSVKLIIFDLQFIQSIPAQDQLLAAAMQQAGNVLISECIQKISLSNTDSMFSGRDDCASGHRAPFISKESGSEQMSTMLTGVRKIVPTRVIADAALDRAPFYLPDQLRHPTIQEVWMYFDVLAEHPSLPLVAWINYLQREGLLHNTIPANQVASIWLAQQRASCKATPQQFTLNKSIDPSLRNKLQQIICGSDSRYLNYYGPPKSIKILPYKDVYNGQVNDLHDKIVFVGKLNTLFAQGKADFFPTPFAEDQTGRMAGVEILATQFSNLLNDQFLEIPTPPILIIVGFGFGISLLLVLFRGFSGLAVSFAGFCTYVGFSIYRFHSAIWLPIIVPFWQLLISYAVYLVWLINDLLKERKYIYEFIKKVFPQWADLIPHLPKFWDTKDESFERQNVPSICLATDIQGYTKTAQQLEKTGSLEKLLKSYYQMLGQPIAANKGYIANIQGDAMMAMWIDRPVAISRYAACVAALEMQQEVSKFNECSQLGSLPTRIGINEGGINLICIRSAGSLFYNPFGDALNTASRIEGVNKYLKTRVLAASAIIDGLTDIIYRPVGRFRLIGKEEPMVLVEIIGIGKLSAHPNYPCYEKFSDGLKLFQQGQWKQAEAIFRSILDRYGYDGPTEFYLVQTQQNQQLEPSNWDGTVVLEGK